MTYRLDPSPQFWARVTVRRPGEQAEPETFRAKFQALAIDAFNEHDLSTEEGTRAFLDEALRDVDEVETMDGSPLSFTDAVRAQMIGAPHLRAALVSAYMAAFREAITGN
ncbi:hypothetical protein [Nitratireductor sp. GZWM139]|uniref:hypothetical protein n=1 Tax=Nitratireductor sp. GZWM139 TaxID=2950541 RepID=UPI0024BDD56C|nr:hypothetical protein [Nitratireductor sp. GZWM139]MDJ1463404.1 hypothetical protein [Nitratireductor sp. GZWM139]